MTDFLHRSATPPKAKWRRIMACMVGQTSRTPRCPDAPRLDGARALVTGGSRGIGRATAEGLAVRGADIVIAARGADTADVAAEIAHATGATVTHWPLDLSDLGAVQAALDHFTEDNEGRALDIVVANAGVSPGRRSVSAQGHERAFAVNVLGHHALLRGLMARGLMASNARIVGVVGDIYCLADDCTPDFQYRGGGMAAYCRSKLGNLWQYSELARRHPGLAVAMVHPGVVATELEGRLTGPTGAVKRGMLLPAKLGAQTSLVCATQPGVQSGGYDHNVHGRVLLREQDPAADKARAARFWDLLDSLAA